MNQEKIGKFIKNLRKKNKLTQQDLADKYNVTYQAVSKWENGKNMPDISLLKQMSKDFNISLEEILDGESKKANKAFKYVIISIIIIIMLGLIIFLIYKSSNDDFKFKTLSSTCKNFNISGSISYNDKKSAIYINNINYCGGDNNKLYKSLECNLYESHGDIDKKISSYNYNKDLIRLDEFLKDVTFVIDDYKNLCSEYKDDELYLLINGVDKDNNNVTYKVFLETNSCN